MESADTAAVSNQTRLIPVLAEIRNKLLDDLVKLHGERQTFDMVLFLNDAVFTVSI
jgi:hypothetical protein